MSRLGGGRVLVTRNADQSEELTRILEDEGATVLLAPLAKRLPPGDLGPLDTALREIGRHDWVLFTSQNGVTSAWERADALGVDLSPLGGVRLGAVGQRTAVALAKRGFLGARVPTQADSDHLLTLLAPLVSPGERVLLLRGEEADADLPRGLLALGAKVEDVQAYRMGDSDPQAMDGVRRAFAEYEIDWITLMSPKAAERLARAVPPALYHGVKTAVIGPKTARRAEETGFRVMATAKIASAQGLLEALLESEEISR